MRKTYICIDLKSFYASVECVARGLDPFSSNLVVADPEGDMAHSPGGKPCHEGERSQKPLPSF